MRSGVCKDKKHKGIEDSILNILNKPKTTNSIMIEVNRLDNYKSVRHHTLLNFLNKLESEKKITKIILSKLKNQSIIWLKL